MKNPWEWDESDLLRLISDGVTESITLDYKESTALNKTSQKKVEISKDVSAFANSAGGTLVYGIVEENHLPKKLDFGSDPKDITREWLEQVINSNVQRKIPDLRINQVLLTTSGLGRVAYVVHVPQSPLAPHQASDKRYYKRYNFQSVAMEDYEVRDVSRRIESPRLRIELQVSFEKILDTDGKEVAIAVIIPIVTNESEVPARWAVIDLLIENRLIVQMQGENHRILHKEADITVEFDGKTITCSRLCHIFGTAGQVPIFSGLQFRLLGTPLRVKLPSESGRYLIGWRVHAPHMEQARDFIQIQNPV